MCINHLRSYWLNAMFIRHHKKLVSGVLILFLIVVIYVLSYHNEEKPPNLTSEVLKNNQDKPLLSTSKEHSSKQQLNTTPKDIQASDEKQTNSLHGKVNYNDKQLTLRPNVIQHLKELAYNQKNFQNYVRQQLSSSDLEDVVRQMGISNLTSTQAQIGFIDCAGMFLLRMQIGKQPNSSILIPPRYKHCKNMSFKKSEPLVGLVSFPSSGNSLVRQLLEAATGIYTGAAFGYCDLHYVKAGMIGENVDTNNVLVVKEHGLPEKVAKNATKVIYLVRNPFWVILAEKNRKTVINSKNHTERNSHTEEVDIKYENNSAWKSWVREESVKWKNQVKQWLHYKKVPVLIAGYDNLMNDKYSELKKMLDFIGYPYTEDDIECAVKSPAEDFHRNHTKKHPNLYPPDLQNYVLNIIKEINADLLKHNISINFTYNEA